MEENGTSKNVTEEQKKEIIQNEKGGLESQFAGLPIGSLTCEPMVAVARAQQELIASYIDGIYKLADEDDSARNESV